VLLVSASDKLYNARAIVTDLHTVGRAVFDRFTAGEIGTLWYYGELARIFQTRLPGGLSKELARTVGLMNPATD
jgi:GTP pyrophosphokinase